MVADSRRRRDLNASVIVFVLVFSLCFGGYRATSAFDGEAAVDAGLCLLLWLEESCICLLLCALAAFVVRGLDVIAAGTRDIVEIMKDGDDGGDTAVSREDGSALVDKIFSSSAPDDILCRIEGLFNGGDVSGREEALIIIALQRLGYLATDSQKQVVEAFKAYWDGRYRMKIYQTVNAAMSQVRQLQDEYEEEIGTVMNALRN